MAVYNGSLTVAGEEIEVVDWVGSQNHNWGSQHTDHYAWGQVAGFDTHPDSFDENSPPFAGSFLGIDGFAIADAQGQQLDAGLAQKEIVIMNAKTWSGATLLIALVIVTLATLVSCQGKATEVPSPLEPSSQDTSGDVQPPTESPSQGRPGEVQLSSPCSDIVDPWTLMSQDERTEACRELISSKAAELGDMGFEPQDCRVTKAEVQECGIGTELACTYTCGNTAE
jgi:hypothetical protein